MKQHAAAILVALVASAISFLHFNPSSYKPSTMPYPYPSPTVRSDSSFDYPTPSSSNINVPHYHPEPKKRQSQPLRETRVHHHHLYRRTDTIVFCPKDDFFSPSETQKERIVRILELEEEDSKFAPHIDEHLSMFQFNFPKKYVDLMRLYYTADDLMVDTYNASSLNDLTLGSTDENYICLVDSALADPRRSVVSMHAMSYQFPPLYSFYQKGVQEKPQHVPPHHVNAGLSVMNLLKEQKQRNGEDGGGDVEDGPGPIGGGDMATSNLAADQHTAALSYTGFTAKFVNLDKRALNLFWDGKEKAKFVGRVEPFQSFLTVTNPGNTFHFAPTYDKDHALQRWTMTADEAMVIYDPYTLDSSPLDLSTLSVDERRQYDMQKLNEAYAMGYLISSRRTWLNTFPRPLLMHYMWNADYFGQEHIVTTTQSHFKSLPNGEDRFERLDYAFFDRMAEGEEKGEETLNLAEYRKQGPLEMKLKVISAAPRAFEIVDFLSPVEADHLVELALRYNVTADFSQKKTKKKKADTDAWVRREYSPILDAIYRRTADALKIDESLLRHRNEHEYTDLNTHHSIAEAIHLTQYTEGQGFIPRHDGVQSALSNRYQPNRHVTIVFFLNDVAEGGELTFPRSLNKENHDGIKIQPKKGNAIVFYNMLPDGNLDDLAHYSSEFLESGEKWLGTLWVWDPIID
jgi:prolyl 4-hydroxylase